jgi:hypothetical protein
MKFVFGKLPPAKEGKKRGRRSDTPFCFFTGKTPDTKFGVAWLWLR